MVLLLLQAGGKIKFFGTRPNWEVSFIAYTKFRSPRPVFHSPSQIFTRIGERASTSFPACIVISLLYPPPPNEVGGGVYWIHYTAQRSWRVGILDSLYPSPTKLEVGYTGFTLSVRPSVCPSVCRRHGFRSISQVCFGISISNFICMLMVKKVEYGIG